MKLSDMKKFTLIIAINLCSILYASDVFFISDSMIIYNHGGVEENIFICNHWSTPETTTNNIGTCEEPFDTIFVRNISFRQESSCTTFSADSFICPYVYKGSFYIDGYGGDTIHLFDESGYYVISSRNEVSGRDTFDNIIITPTDTYDINYNIYEPSCSLDYTENIIISNTAPYKAGMNYSIWLVTKNFFNRTNINSLSDFMKYITTDTVGTQTTFLWKYKWIGCGTDNLVPVDNRRFPKWDPIDTFHADTNYALTWRTMIITPMFIWHNREWTVIRQKSYDENIDDYFSNIDTSFPDFSDDSRIIMFKFTWLPYVSYFRRNPPCTRRCSDISAPSFYWFMY